MLDNKNLNKAKAKQDDEFYTNYKDIENELQYFNFENSVVYLPCDDYKKSNFVKYFEDNFFKLKLKKIIATCYNKGGKGKKYIYDGKNKIVKKLKGNGDFLSIETAMIKDSEADYIITNPPFSKFRSFIDWVKNKKFLIIGGVMSIGYLNVFELFYTNQLDISNMLGLKFNRLDKSEKKVICQWYTNIKKHKKHKKKITLNTISYNSKNNKKLQKYKNAYKKYDNYDAIEIPLIKAIPSDYLGLMGCPISFFQYDLLDDFEVVGMSRGQSKQWFGGKSCYIEDKELFNRLFIKRRKNNVEKK